MVHLLFGIVALILLGLFWRIILRVVGVLALVGVGIAVVALIVVASQRPSAPVRTIATTPAECFAPQRDYPDPDPDVRAGMAELRKAMCWTPGQGSAAR